MVVLVNDNDFGATVTMVVVLVDNNDFWASAMIVLSNVDCGHTDHGADHEVLTDSTTVTLTSSHLHLSNKF